MKYFILLTILLTSLLLSIIENSHEIAYLDKQIRVLELQAELDIQEDYYE